MLRARRQLGDGDVDLFAPPDLAPSSSSSDTHAPLASKKWKCACINYVPNDSSLYFQAAYCQPGDARNNARDTTARVFCSFTDGTNKK